MNIIKSIVQLSIGTVFGIGMVLSCGDSSPHRTDAATCDCPASEAPIAGRVVVIEGTPRVIQAGQDGAVGTGCMRGMQFLSGSCQPADPTTLRNITLIQFGFDKVTLNWLCVFKNNEVAPVTVNASVLCLKPPG